MTTTIPDASSVITWILWICSGIAVVATAVVWIVRGVQAVRAPQKQLDKRVTALETTVEAYKAYFSADKSRLDELEAGNRVTQQAILALLSHAIDGNDIQSLQEAKAALHAYLLSK